MLKWYKVKTPLIVTSVVVARDLSQGKRHVAGEVERLLKFLRDREWDITQGETVSCEVMEDWYENDKSG